MSYCSYCLLTVTDKFWNISHFYFMWYLWCKMLNVLVYWLWRLWRLRSLWKLWKQWLTHLVTTWKQEILAHLKRLGQLFWPSRHSAPLFLNPSEPPFYPPVLIAIGSFFFFFNLLTAPNCTLGRLLSNYRYLPEKNIFPRKKKYISYKKNIFPRRKKYISQRIHFISFLIFIFPGFWVWGCW